MRRTSKNPRVQAVLDAMSPAEVAYDDAVDALFVKLCEEQEDWAEQLRALRAESRTVANVFVVLARLIAMEDVRLARSTMPRLGDERFVLNQLGLVTANDIADARRGLDEHTSQH